MAVNGSAVAAVAAGSVLTYAGLRGYSVVQAVQYLVQGKSPATLPQTLPITDPPVAIPTATDPGAGVVGPGSASGQAIANDALRYKGAGYVWGGPADRPGNWDCSSYVSYVLGKDLGLPLPGGRWGGPGMPPSAHGPTTREYLRHGAAVPYGRVQAGDLVVWADHIGIAISGTHMIAARSQALGTGVSRISDGARYHGGQPSIRRVGRG